VARRALTGRTTHLAHAPGGPPDPPRYRHSVSSTTSDLRHWLAELPAPDLSAHPFDPDTAPVDPVPLFLSWLHEAVEAGVPAPQSMTLATVDPAGRPDARILMLSDIDESAFWVAASTASPKGRQLQQVPVAALVFHWPQLGRQVRVRGVVRAADEQRTAACFAELPPEVRAEALADRQSRHLFDEVALSDELGDVTDLVQLEPEVVAPTWRLWGVDAGRLEFYQYATDRHHVRLRYSRQDDGTYEQVQLRP